LTQTNSMEVHHSHHSGGHKKNWKEYITEFIMLFAAVTLGFFAENLREHQIEKNREIQFLQNIHFDLEQDLKEIEIITAFNHEKQLMNDSLVIEFQTKGYQTNLSRFYYLVKNAIIRKFFDHSSSGFTQLKNAGGLRLIEDKSIIQKIIGIENTVMIVESLQESMDQNLLLLREELNGVLDPVTNNKMNRSQNLMNRTDPYQLLRRYNYPEDPQPLTTYDRKELGKLINLCSGPVNTTLHINFYLDQLKKQEEILNDEILKKFGDRFKD
jgi:hypothetical protein